MQVFLSISSELLLQLPPIRLNLVEYNFLINFQALDDIEVAMKILKHTVSSENPVDTHYKGLDVNLDALDSSDSDFKVCCCFFSLSLYWKNSCPPHTTLQVSKILKSTVSSENPVDIHYKGIGVSQDALDSRVQRKIKREQPKIFREQGDRKNNLGSIDELIWGAPRI